MTPGLEEAIAECVRWFGYGLTSGAVLVALVLIAQRR